VVQGKGEGQGQQRRHGRPAHLVRLPPAFLLPFFRLSCPLRSDKIFKEVPTYKMISQSILIERMKINGSVARKAMRTLEAQGLIKKVVHHHGQWVYSAFLPSSLFTPVLTKFLCNISPSYRCRINVSPLDTMKNVWDSGIF
jgi:hypothetical protein